MSEQGDLIIGAGRAIARKVRRLIGQHLQKQALGEGLQRHVFFAALSQLVIEVFTVAPTHTTPTKAQRRELFEEFQRVTREDFEATLETLEGP